MLSQFNPQQKEAVTYLDGPLLVLAGAGSGKTRVITGKIAYLIAQCGIRPNRIAAITFTNKAASEMTHRIGQLLGTKAKSVTISTFHSLGVKILRTDGGSLGLKPQFSILDSHDCFSILQGLIPGMDKKAVLNAQSQISRWKTRGLSPETVENGLSNEDDFSLIGIFKHYQRTIESYQAVDFDDLIRLPLRLFIEHPDVLSRWQNQLHYLLVDEYQDTNAMQYGLLRQLAGVRGAFTVVGDDNQSIYAWRGATIGNLTALTEDYSNLKTIKLEQNYRSTGHILNAANQLITFNDSQFEKKLWSALGPGEPVNIRQLSSDDAEAEWVAMKLLSHKSDSRASFSDYAVLYRSNHQSRRFEQYFRENNIPYVVSGGMSFFERSEIKDIMAYLRLIVNDEDDAAFIRAATTPRRGIGAVTLEKLGQYAGQRQCGLFEAAFETGFSSMMSQKQLAPLVQFCEFISHMQDRARKEDAHVILSDLVRAIEYEEYLYANLEPKQAEMRWNNIMDFVQWVTRKSTDTPKHLSELVQTMTLISILDRQDNDFDAVTLSTIHASKGLEFSHVFLVSVEEGLLPHRESLDDEHIEEERRLMYVAVTRAKRTLFVSHCKKRQKGKEWSAPEPSRFIKEMGCSPFPLESGNAMEKKESRMAQLKRIKARLAEANADLDFNC